MAKALSDAPDEVGSEGGVHLELLLKEKKHFSGEPNLAQAQFNERLAAVKRPRSLPLPHSGQAARDGQGLRTQGEIDHHLLPRFWATI
jgi:hypothetical protein